MKAKCYLQWAWAAVMALVLLNVSSAVAARNGYNGAPLPAAISVQLEARKFVYYASDPLT